MAACLSDDRHDELPTLQIGHLDMPLARANHRKPKRPMTQDDITDATDATQRFRVVVRERHGLDIWTWHRLMDFADESFATDFLLAHHPQLGRRDLQNVKKQAANIRHCILQAKEYFGAASLASLATKPNLLYYGISSLAYTIPLLKGDGCESFDYKRKSGKGHHGLVLVTAPSAKDAPMAYAAQKLTSRVNGRRSEPHGTFADLLRFMGPEPVFSRTEKIVDFGYEASSLDLVATTAAPPPNALMNQIFSLADAISYIPDLTRPCRDTGAAPSLGVARVSRRCDGHGNWTASITAEVDDATDKELLVGSLTLGGVPIRDAKHCGVRSFGKSLALRSSLHGKPPEFGFPPAAHDRAGKIHLYRSASSRTSWLPPLVASYIAMYQLSMLVRYYPDVWMHAIESRSSFLALISEVVDHLEQDAPILALEQMANIKVLHLTATTNLER